MEHLNSFFLWYFKIHFDELRKRGGLECEVLQVTEVAIFFFPKLTHHNFEFYLLMKKQEFLQTHELLQTSICHLCFITITLAMSY